MAKVTVISRNGEGREVEAENGLSLMEVIRDNGFDELLALCGGCCSCATCHVHIDPAWVAKIEPADPNRGEIELLEYDQNFKKETSRLACQITLGPEHDGLIAHLITDK